MRLPSPLLRGEVACRGRVVALGPPGRRSVADAATPRAPGSPRGSAGGSRGQGRPRARARRRRIRGCRVSRGARSRLDLLTSSRPAPNFITRQQESDDSRQQQGRTAAGSDAGAGPRRRLPPRAASENRQLMSMRSRFLVGAGPAGTVSDTEPEERAPRRSRLFGKGVTVPSHARHGV